VCRVTATKDDGEVPKDITVQLTDNAGNIVIRKYGTVIYDMTEPEIRTSSVDPGTVNANTKEIMVYFDFSEKVDKFKKEYLTVDPAGKLTNYICENGSGDFQKYKCTFNLKGVVEPFNEYSFYITASAKDLAGNSVAGAPFKIGTIKIDNTLPEIGKLENWTNETTVNKTTGEVEISFKIKEVSKIVSANVYMGDYLISSQNPEAVDGTYAFKYQPNEPKSDGTLTDPQGDGEKAVYVEVTDEFGNRSEKTEIGVITYDRTDPVFTITVNQIVNAESTLNLTLRFSEPVVDVVPYLTNITGEKIEFHSCTADSDRKVFSCIYTPKEEISASYSIFISASDDNGNTISDVDTGKKITFYTITPKPVSSQMTRSPQFAPAIDKLNNTYYFSTSDPNDNSKQVEATLEIEINEPVGQVVEVIAYSVDNILKLYSTDEKANIADCSITHKKIFCTIPITNKIADGNYRFKVKLKNMYDSETKDENIDLPNVKFVVDNSAPDIDMGRVVYTRVPWGNEEHEDPYFEIEATDSVDASKVGLINIYEVGESKQDRKVIEGITVDADGSAVIGGSFNYGPDFYVAAVSKAGVVSELNRIRNINWIASMTHSDHKMKLFESNISRDSLYQPDRWENYVVGDQLKEKGRGVLKTEASNYRWKNIEKSIFFPSPDAPAVQALVYNRQYPSRNRKT